MTPGQAAYEAFKAWRAERDPMMLVADWMHPMVGAAHGGWEAAAQAARDLGAPAEPQPAPDLGAAYADLESEIRVAVSLHCTGPGVPCDLCLRETDRAMKAIDAYAREVAQHERARKQPAPAP